MKKSQAQLRKPALADRVIALIENARQKVAYTANLAQVYTNDLQCQMQTYVHYYDRHVKQPDENPTIGILLCSDDNKALVEMTLPEAEQRQIFARRYSAIIPSKDKLASIIREEQEKYEKEKLLARAAGKGKGRGK